MDRNFARCLLKSVVFAAGFALNPGYLTGCEASDDDASEGADLERYESQLLDDLADANAKGTWAFTTNHGKSYEVMLALEQAEGEDQLAAVSGGGRSGLIQRAHACGTHTFFQGASACATLYEVAVKGTLSLREQGASQAIAPGVAVTGRLDNYGSLRIEFASDESIELQKSADQWKVVFFSGQSLGPDAVVIPAP
jgi:hypothetical protein